MLPTLRTRNAWPVVHNPWSTFNRMLDDFFTENASELATINNLGSIDVHEDEKNLYVDAELPGFNKDQIHLVLEDGVLNLQAERSEEVKEEKKKNYYVRERSYGKWARSIRLPVPVQEDKVQASFDNGILKITMEKREQKKTHKIEVK
jgi:HSP20 family protein